MTQAETAAKALADNADELGELELELTPMKAKIQRADALRRAMRAPYANADPTLSYEIRGAHWVAIIGPAGNESTVDVERLLKLVGAKKLAPVASVSVRTLSEHFGADVVAAVVSTAQTGTRKLQMVPAGLMAKKKAS